MPNIGEAESLGNAATYIGSHGEEGLVEIQRASAPVQRASKNNLNLRPSVVLACLLSTVQIRASTPN
jgi:hypothetical protein